MVELVGDERLGQIAQELLEDVGQVDDVVAGLDALAALQLAPDVALARRRTRLPEQSLRLPLSITTTATTP